MGRDLKISELTRASIDTTIANLTQNGKYIVPAYVSNEGSRSIDLGLLLSVFVDYINTAAAQAVQDIIDQGGGGGGGDTPSTDYQSQITNLSNRVNNLSNQLTQLRTDVTNPTNYPTTYIELVDLNNTVAYQIPSGYGQRSSYTINNPITINVSSFRAPNYLVSLSILGQTETVNQSDSTKKDITIAVRIIITANNGYEGGAITSLVISGRMSTSGGTYERTVSVGPYGDPQSESSGLTIEQNLQYTTPNNISIDAHFVTCSINSTDLGLSASYIPSSQSSNGVTGSITIPNSNGS